MTEFEPLDRDTAIKAVALSMELIEQRKLSHALHLLDELLGRLLVDSALEEKADMIEVYGRNMLRQ